MESPDTPGRLTTAVGPLHVLVRGPHVGPQLGPWVLVISGCREEGRTGPEAIRRRAPGAEDCPILITAVRDRLGYPRPVDHRRVVTPAPDHKERLCSPSP